jgi:hypothetical protein
VLKYPDGDIDDGHELTAREREFLRVMRSRRVEDLLKATDPSVTLLHKFSVACPAHIAVGVMCAWFGVVMGIVSLVIVRDSSRYLAVHERLAALEGYVANFTNANTSTIV